MMHQTDKMLHAHAQTSLWQTIWSAAIAAPLPIAQSLLTPVASRMARTRPDLFARMGRHAHKVFIIDPIDLPYVIRLIPDTAAPVLTIHAREKCPAHDGAIRGKFLQLLNMIDGTLDGDALFFTRDLVVTGDVEAVVTLRNALDDFDGDLVREILQGLGPLTPLGTLLLQALRSTVETKGR